MRILFQGDSITDAGRDRSDPHNLAGYTLFAAQQLGDGFEYVNLGISGNRSADVLARYEKDIAEIKPDLMTLLIGINDVWRQFDSNSYTSAEQYKNNLLEIITRYKKGCPNGKLILMEPFLVPVSDKMHWRRELIAFIDVVRELAVKYADGFVPLDGLLAKAALEHPYADLSGDGVHPAPTGQKVIAAALAEEILRVIKG